VSGASRWSLDVSVLRTSGGRVLVGGRPGRVVRLTPGGAGVLDAALAGTPPGTDSGRALIARLVAGELLHPSEHEGELAPGRVTFVVPVRDGVAHLAPLVAALRPLGPVVVVDDGSRDDSRDVARAAGATVLPNDGPPGPSGARNTGLRAAATDLVAFVDSDCRLPARWVEPLAALFEDPGLAIAAPRVRSVAGASRLERYELACSPLDLGPHPALVAPGRRLSYVPSAVIVTRRSALLGVGGFAPELLVGEDVDLVWRLARDGWRVRYAPESEIEHHPRRDLRGLARQRHTYGRSAAILQSRHPRAAAPLHVVPDTVAIWASYAALGPAAAAGALLANAGLAAAGAPRSDLRFPLARAVAAGHAQATRHLLRIVVREWLPVTALACAASRRARRLAAAALAVDAAASFGGGRHGLDPVTHAAFRLLDNAAYSAGLWQGARRQRSLGALGLRSVKRIERQPEPPVSGGAPAAARTTTAA
jgi:mycofactocin system glycosyltransferase